MSGDEEAVIRRTGEEAIELNLEALTRIGNEWPRETAAFLEAFRPIASMTSDQMAGGEWDDREITVTVYLKAADVGEAIE